mmetsp:Transcript_32992/g.76011  ORF Transcript_32992/g.76011 Transcript_32992/m.76011 type:complete len:352 (-) Transcript_32992:217-1272(-)
MFHLSSRGGAGMRSPAVAPGILGFGLGHHLPPELGEVEPFETGGDVSSGSRAQFGEELGADLGEGLRRSLFGGRRTGGGRGDFGGRDGGVGADGERVRVGGILVRVGRRGLRRGRGGDFVVVRRGGSFGRGGGGRVGRRRLFFFLGRGVAVRGREISAGLLRSFGEGGCCLGRGGGFRDGILGFVGGAVDVGRMFRLEHDLRCRVHFVVYGSIFAFFRGGRRSARRPCVILVGVDRHGGLVRFFGDATLMHAPLLSFRAHVLDDGIADRPLLLRLRLRRRLPHDHPRDGLHGLGDRGSQPGGPPRLPPRQFGFLSTLPFPLRRDGRNLRPGADIGEGLRRRRVGVSRGLRR